MTGDLWEEAFQCTRRARNIRELLQGTRPFILLTGARYGAVVSLKIKHLDLAAGWVVQDPREVATKFGKTITTTFFPVGDDIRSIVEAWAECLTAELRWGPDDPLFPSTMVECGNSKAFQVSGLERRHWSSAEPIRKIFRRAFSGAGLPYYPPHRLRNTLVLLGEGLCQSPAAFKAWSQNLGHSDMLTTFTSYGELSVARQVELIRELGRPRKTNAEALSMLQEATKVLLRG